MKGIENNLNRERILEINDEIMNLALSVNFDDSDDKLRARERLQGLIDERKRLFTEGIIPDEVLSIKTVLAKIVCKAV